MGLHLEHGEHVLVCDGGRALLLQNVGDEEFPNLETVWSTSIENPPSRDQGTERPTRVFESVGPRRSAGEPRDFHHQAEANFVGDVVRHVGEIKRRGNLRSLVVVAPPRALADVRRLLPDHLRKAVRHEISKNLTNLSVYAIECQLTKNDGG